MSLDEKVVVVTGASEGIGAALATACSAKGAKVVLAARRRPQLEAIAAQCRDALVVPTDVTKRADVQRLLDESVKAYGRVDAWVNNAGRGISRSALELTDAELDEMMAVNVKSALYGMQVAAAHFRARGQGHLVNVSSMLGRVPFAPQRSAYNAAKHALNALTANVRDELKGTGVRVTLFLPGVVATHFGLNALGGGVDSRALPGAQDVHEVARLLVGALEDPRDEVYSRPGQQEQVVEYFRQTTR